MKKNICTIFLTILLTVLFVLLIGSFGAQNCIVKTISAEFTGKYVSGYILDEIVENNYDIDIISSIDKKVKSNQYIDDITEEFIDVLIFNLMNDCYKNIHIEDELNAIMDKELTDVSETTKKFVESSVNKVNFKEIMDKFTDSINTGWSSIKPFINLYSIVTSILFRLIVIFLIIVIVIDIIILNANILKTFRCIGVSLSGSSCIIGIGTIVVKLLTNILRQKAFGGRISGFYLRGCVNIGIVCLVIGILIIIFSVALAAVKKNN